MSYFADYVNSELIFQLPSRRIEIDSTTGNRSPLMTNLRMKASLSASKDKGDRNLEENPGVDRPAVKLYGYCVDPMFIPDAVAPYAKAAIRWNQYSGEFTLDPLRRSPYAPVDELLGDRITGKLRIVEFTLFGDGIAQPEENRSELLIVSAAGQTRFTLPFTSPDPDSIELYVFGSKATWGQEYTIEQDQLVWRNADLQLNPGDDLEVVYR